MPDISLIIPAYNEEKYLPQLLKSVENAKDNFTGDKKQIEVIVSDNNSIDNTVAIAKSFNCKITSEKKRVIAAVRNKGASLANGEILAFVDADSTIHVNTFNAINEALASTKVIGGATGVTLSRYSLGIRLTYWMMVPLLWASGLDSGVVFCRKQDFLEAGPYNEELLFGEDVQFLLNLKKLGKVKGQKIIKLHSSRAITSSRKFDKHGDWHYFPFFAKGFIGMLTSFSRYDTLARNYWYGKQREE